MHSRLQENVKTLIKIIEDDITANKEEMTQKIPSFIQEYETKQKELTTSNTQLQQ